MTPAYTLSADRRTLMIKRWTPAGIQTVTLRREDRAGPFTDTDVDAALAGASAATAATRMQPGQRNTARRVITRFGTLWTDIMTGPPTWWAPRCRREKDGTLMAGWLRFAVAARFDRTGRCVAGEEGGDG